MTEYTDEDVVLYPINTGTINCRDYFRSYSYKISAVDVTTLESVFSDRGIINGYISPCNEPDRFILPSTDNPKFYFLYNYPNPFNPSTQIRYSIP